VQRSSTQQTFIEAPVERVWELVGDPNRHPEWWPEMLEIECADLKEGCRYRGVVKGPFGAAAHDLVVDRFEDCREVSIFCDGTGVTTRFVLTDAQGGTFVEGCFTIEPNSIGMKVLGAVTGRRFMHSWLESSHRLPDRGPGYRWRDGTENSRRSHTEIFGVKAPDPGPACCRHSGRDGYGPRHGRRRSVGCQRDRRRDR
jgi:uncharacterized protein YndB with AHSA1/START domain